MIGVCYQQVEILPMFTENKTLHMTFETTAWLPEF